MKHTEIESKGKEFFNVKFENNKNFVYLRTRAGKENILVDYAQTGDDQCKGTFKVLPEEFFSEDGIDLFKERLNKENKEFMMVQARINKLKGR